MNMELRSTGASFVAGKLESNPLDLVSEAIEKNPTGTRAEQFEAFRELLDQHSDAYQRAVDWYFFLNMHSYNFTNRNGKSEAVDRSIRRTRQSEMVESIKAQIMLLDLAMPNGKPMRACTGAEMAKFGNRYQRIAEKVGKVRTVGMVLDEEQVRKIMQ